MKSKIDLSFFPVSGFLLSSALNFNSSPLLDIEPGTQIIAWVEDEQLILKPKKQLWAAIHQEAEKIPKGVDLAEELIKERRQAAKAYVYQLTLINLP